MKKIVDFLAFHSSTIVAILGVATAILNVMAQKKDSAAEEIKNSPQPCTNIDLNVNVFQHQGEK
jgi:hypothetical protein